MSHLEKARGGTGKYDDDDLLRFLDHLDNLDSLENLGKMIKIIRFSPIEVDNVADFLVCCQLFPVL